jgi:hypothetical protein
MRISNVYDKRKKVAGLNGLRYSTRSNGNSHDISKETKKSGSIRTLLNCLVFAWILFLSSFIFFKIKPNYRWDSLFNINNNSIIHTSLNANMPSNFKSKSSTDAKDIFSASKITSEYKKDSSPHPQVFKPTGIPTSSIEIVPAVSPEKVGSEHEHYLHMVKSKLADHYFHSLINSSPTISLEDTIYQLFKYPKCVNSPIYITMAAVATDTYWQMVENFIYAMLKFDLIGCSLMICVSDENCMNLCKRNNFPCYNYVHKIFHPVSNLITHNQILYF